MTTILFLFLFGVVAAFGQVFILNIFGLPGAVIAGKPEIRSKTQFVVGSIISGLGQSFINLSFVAFVISWTTFRISDNGSSFRFFVWLIAFLIVILPTWKSLIAARVEDNEREVTHGNPQLEGLYLTILLTVIAYFVFLFAPVTMTFLWSWVPYVN